jgi:hypothetical protein
MVALLALWWARYSLDLPSLALLSDEGLNDLDDLVLLSSGEAGDFVKGLANSPDRPAAGR